jgi:glutathione S-transferase
MIKLYYVPNTRSIRIAWLCEELGLPYERIDMKLSEHDLRTPEMLARNPFGKVPAVEDGDTTIFESGAIIEYLLDTCGEGRLRPDIGTPDYYRYLEWVHGSETLAGFVSVVLFTVSRAPQECRSDALTEAAADRARFGLQSVERNFGEGPFICGEAFTAADIMLTWSIHFCTMFNVLPDEATPKLADYFERMKARDGWQKAVAE